MTERQDPDLVAAAATLHRIEHLVRRLRSQLGDPPAARPNRRAVTLREAALRALPRDHWMTLDDWEQTLTSHGYKPPKNPKRADQTRRSLASLAARNRHLIDADGKGRYRLSPVEAPDPLLD